jgi:hypothetical protein
VIVQALAMAKAVRLTPPTALPFGFVHPLYLKVWGCALFFLFEIFQVFRQLDPRQMPR